jgi:dimethylhistidine N-methyltransferase
MGLSSEPKKISAKYFYDDKGSELFQKITQHEDYYPTRTEFKILSDIKEKLPELIVEDNVDIVELGSGDGHKSRIILDGFLNQGKKTAYYPIDISEKAMHLLDDHLPKHENLKSLGVVGEYFEGVRYVSKESSNKKLVLFLGSNIGNFGLIQSQGFLRRLWRHLDHGDQVLIGFDLKKEISVLNKAYNDSSGVTRDFNLNLLNRINKELSADFKPENFVHYGAYNPILGAMESFLISTKKQSVRVDDLERTFDFKEYEPIHLEYSFKFLKSEIESLANQTGYEIIKHFSDEKNYFVDSLWTVKK